MHPHLAALEAEQRAALAALEAVLDSHAPFHSDPTPFVQYTSLVGRSIVSPAPNSRLALRRVLGVGAYGVVYAAEEFCVGAHSRQHTAGRMYAVKVMRCAPMGSRQRAFQAREVALHRRANGHPGIVALAGVFGTGSPPVWTPKRKTWSSDSALVRREDELTWDADAQLSGDPLLLDDGTPEELVYMVLAYIPGGDLFSKIAEDQRYIADDALIRHVFVQLLDAVEWCHDRGIRHRDLKPENILCDHQGQTVYIGDFGLATMDEYSRDYGCGSSYYMSPECFGNPVQPEKSPSYDTRANDVWTLGVVLVNLTTGRNPWEAASPLDSSFAEYRKNPREFLMTILPITPAANNVLLRVFELDQAKRCTVSELRQLVMAIERWTLRGSELENASEGARDVALGCGLFDLAPPTVPSQVESTESAGRSRFSTDSVIDAYDADYESEDDLSVVEWYGYTRPPSSASMSSEMSRSRPVSKILSNSPTVQGSHEWVDPSEQDPKADQSIIQLSRDSIPRWPGFVRGWEDPEAVVGDVTLPGPRTPSPTPVWGVENTPRATPREPRDKHVPGLGVSAFVSKIPRYIGSPRARTTSFDPPSRLAPVEPTGRERMQSAPGPGSRSKMSLGEFSSGLVGRLRAKASASRLCFPSTISAASSSESSGFPGTPQVLASPRLIVSHPSEGKLWNIVPASSAQSLWDESACSYFQGPGAQGAALFDVRPQHLPGLSSSSSPSLSDLSEVSYTSANGTPRRRVKRVPVPPIPSELLEEHERQLSMRRNASGATTIEMSVDAPVHKVTRLAGPPTKPKRLLDNARAWFRRI